METQITKKDLEQILTQKLDEQSKDLKAHSEKVATDLQEELARMTNSGFDNVNEQLADIAAKLDVREQIKIFELKFQKLEEALHIKL